MSLAIPSSSLSQPTLIRSSQSNNINFSSLLDDNILSEIFKFLTLQDHFMINRANKHFKKLSDLVSVDVKLSRGMENVFRSINNHQSGNASEMTPLNPLIVVNSTTFFQPMITTAGNQIALVTPFKRSSDSTRTRLMIQIARIHRKTMSCSSNFFIDLLNAEFYTLKGLRFCSRNQLEVLLVNEIIKINIIRKGLLNGFHLSLSQQPSITKNHRSDPTLNQTPIETYYDRNGRLFLSHPPKDTILDSIKVIQSDGIEYELDPVSIPSPAKDMTIQSDRDLLLVVYFMEEHQLKLCLYDLNKRTLVLEKTFQDCVMHGEKKEIFRIEKNNFFFLMNQQLFIRTSNNIVQKFHQMDLTNLSLVGLAFECAAKDDLNLLRFKVHDAHIIMILKNKDNSLFLNSINRINGVETSQIIKENSLYSETNIVDSKYLAIKTTGAKGYSSDITYFCIKTMKKLFQTCAEKHHYFSLSGDLPYGLKNKEYVLYTSTNKQFSLPTTTINRLRMKSKPDSLKEKMIRLTLKLITIARKITKLVVPILYGLSLLTLIASNALFLSLPTHARLFSHPYFVIWGISLVTNLFCFLILKERWQ